MGEKKVSSITANNKADMRNIYKSNHRYTDRNAKGINIPQLDVKVTSLSTVLLLLQSSEDDVKEKALNHLDKYASLGNHQLYELTENRIYDCLLKLKKSENVIVKKFTYKLIVQLILNIDECRRKLLTDDSLIEESKDIFIASMDDNLVEYSCLILQNIFNDPKRIDTIGRDETFLRAIFKRFTSHDPDILLQSLLLLNLIMKNSILLPSILNMKDFPFKNLQIELKNDCQLIRLAAIESLLIISSYEHPFKTDFASDRLVAVIYDYCMLPYSHEQQKFSLKLYRNICKNDDKLLIKLSQHLPEFRLKFTDIDFQNNRDEILSILTEFSRLDDNRKVLCQNGIFKDVYKLMKENCSIEACNFMSVMSTCTLCFNEIFSENIYKILLDAVDVDCWEKSLTIFTTFHKLIHLYGLDHLEEIHQVICGKISDILVKNPPIYVTNVLIVILEKLACYSELKKNISATNVLANAVYSTFHSSWRSTKLLIRLFHLITIYIDQETFRTSFVDCKMFDMIKHYLQSNVIQMRVTVCNLINISSNYHDFAMRIVDEGILRLLFSNDCICSDGIEAILAADLSLKFMLRRKLDVNDRIMSGFYATRFERMDFMEMRQIMSTDSLSPINTIYTVNFDDCDKFDGIERRIQKDKNLMQLKQSLMTDDYFKHANEMEKVKILARKVANFLQTDNDCTSHHLQMHLRTLKFKFSSSVIPIGSLMYGYSFEAALLFKSLADHVNLHVTLVADKNGKSWNEIFDGNNIVDLIFDIGEMYECGSVAGQKYLQKIS